ncbi:hypothetical protein [Jiella mangrovi]|uniref:Uncharacterized protein n=1 Tax=Jiella mangrovi TaxID=2821407 RepID=A0ABS4BHA9_9HYPH|nr:hypothetical protein [Jiella mangrovi]MBP0616139.1 hypothetical protein [Jiella mangrovi]
MPEAEWLGALAFGQRRPVIVGAAENEIDEAATGAVALELPGRPHGGAPVGRQTSRKPEYAPSPARN